MIYVQAANPYPVVLNAYPAKAGATNCRNLRYLKLRLKKKRKSLRCSFMSGTIEFPTHSNFPDFDLSFRRLMAVTVEVVSD